jgi:hypothetical protein
VVFCIDGGIIFRGVECEGATWANGVVWVYGGDTIWVGGGGYVGGGGGLILFWFSGQMGDLGICGFLVGQSPLLLSPSSSMGIC